MEPNRPRFALQCGWVTERIVSLIANSADRVRAEPLDLDYNTCDVAMDGKRAPLTFILCIEGILLALLSTKEPVDSLNSMMNTVFLNFIKKRISLRSKVGKNSSNGQGGESFLTTKVVLKVGWKERWFR